MIAVCAIAKSENSYLREWVEYHFTIGFDKIYLYDNNARGGERFEDVLGDMIADGRVEVIDVRGRRRHQLRAYRHYGRHYAELYDWTAYIDIDEFVTLTPESGCTTIGEYLAHADGFDVVHLNWLCYGDNGLIHRTEGGVRERFTTHVNFSNHINDHVKSIVRGSLKARWHGNPHTPANKHLRVCGEDFESVSNEPFRKATHSRAYISHYFTKTIEEYISSKLLRGGGNGGVHNIELFYVFNEHTAEKSALEKELLSQIEIPHEDFWRRLQRRLKI